MSKSKANLITILLMMFGALQPIIWFVVYIKLENWAGDSAAGLSMACLGSMFFFIIVIVILCAYLIDTKTKKNE